MFYKVVKVVNNSLYSVMRDVVPFPVEYKLNEWIESPLKKSKVFFFKSLNRARDFRNIERSWSGDDLEIYECDVGNIELIYRVLDIPSIIRMLEFDQKDVLNKFWEDRLRAGYPTPIPIDNCDFKTSSAPQESYVTDKIKLLREADF